MRSRLRTWHDPRAIDRLIAVIEQHPSAAVL